MVVVVVSKHVADSAVENAWRIYRTLQETSDPLSFRRKVATKNC